MLILLSLIWGTSYILIKKSLVVYHPVQVACLRLSISAIAFAPFFVARLRQLRADQFWLLLAVGLAGSGIPAFLYAIAQTRISSSMAGTLSALAPLFTLLLGVLFFGTRARWAKFAGIFIGLAGALLLIIFGRGGEIEGQFGYGMLVFLATLCYAISSNIVGHHLRQMSSLSISAFSFFLVGVPAFIYLLAGSGFVTTLTTVPGAYTALGYVTILALFSTVLASVLYFRLIQATSAVFGSMVSYLVPAVALLWGNVDGETIGPVYFAGLVLILGGVYLSRK